MTDPHQPDTPPGTDPRAIERRAELAEHLGKEVWPADRDALIAHAEQTTAPDRVLSALRRLPAGQTLQNTRRGRPRAGDRHGADAVLSGGRG